MMDTDTLADAAEQTKLNEPLVTFYNAYPDSLSAMSADRSALGTIPTRAYQYCEALTTASAFGWYAFPAASVTLYFDGTDIYRLEDDTRIRIGSEQISGMDDWWNNHCPEYLTDKSPPFLTSLGVPGYLQVWSGLLIQSRKNWSSLVRPLANVATSNQYFCFEGIIETDTYSPAPLFVNLKLQATHTPIVLSATEPLFQVQPIHRACYSKSQLQTAAHHNIAQQSQSNEGMSDNDWLNYSKTIRPANPRQESQKTGEYATGVRKRKRSHDLDQYVV